MTEASYELYNSIIYTPVDFPNCFAGNLDITTILELNFANIASVANAFARFFIYADIKKLLIVGGPNSHALNFFNDLEHALKDEKELIFSVGNFEIEDLKSVILLRDIDETIDNSLVLNFLDTTVPYEHFSRKDFASFIFCGNTEYGPIKHFTCKRKVICERRLLSRIRPCTICNRPNRKERLKPVNILNVLSEDYIDEGVAVEPLGIPKALFMMNFDLTDSDTDTD